MTDYMYIYKYKNQGRYARLIAAKLRNQIFIFFFSFLRHKIDRLYYNKNDVLFSAPSVVVLRFTPLRNPTSLYERYRVSVTHQVTSSPSVFIYIRVLYYYYYYYTIYIGYYHKIRSLGINIRKNRGEYLYIIIWTAYNFQRYTNIYVFVLYT